MATSQYVVRDNSAPHFLTFTVIDWVDVFTRASYKDLLVDSLNHCIAKKGLEVFGWVIMSNHMHLLVQSAEGLGLADIIRDYKKFTSKAILQAIAEGPESRAAWMLRKFAYVGGRKHGHSSYRLWQKGYHAIEICNTYMLLQKLEYIHQNPVKARLVDSPENYVYSSAIDYSGGKGLVNVVLV